MMTKIRILLVEDNPDDRFLIKRGIRRGLDSVLIIEAHLQDALQPAIQQGDFDIVVTDYNLGWTNGIEVLKAVKQHWPHIPVIMMTVMDEEETAILAMQAGLDNYVVKSSSQFALMGDTIRGVLDQIESVKALREAQTRYLSLSESVPVGLFRVLMDGTQLEVNQFLVERLNYPNKPALLAVNSRDLYEDPEIRSVNYQQFSSENTLYTWEATLKTYDGERRHMRIYAHAIFDNNKEPLYVEGYVQDISEQRRMEKALMTSEVLNQTIIASVHDGVLVTDQDLNIVVWNKFMEALSGYTEEETLGRPASELLHNTTPRGVEESLQLALVGNTINSPDTAFFFPKSEARGWIQLTYAPLRDVGNEVIGVVATVHDITERKENETERERLLTEEQKRSRELAALTTASTTISSNLQINQVLTVVAEQMIELLNADSCTISSWTAGQPEINRMVQYTPNSDPAGLQMPISRSVANIPEFRIVLEDQQLVKINISDESVSQPLREEMIRSNTQCLMIIPLQIQDRIIGCVELEDRHIQRSFLPQDVYMAQMLANHAAVALENARLYEELEDAYIQTVIALANAVDIRDTYTHDHSQRIAILAQETGEAFGMSKTELENLRWGALLHDIGKIGIPDEILRKPAKLTDEEYQIIKKHPALGAAIIAPVKKLEPVAPIIRAHQEWYDGSGYPDGLAGEEIPLAARILAVVDTYIAITDERIYRKARSHEEALAELRRFSGTQFDPAVVDVFFEVMEKIETSLKSEKAETD